MCDVLNQHQLIDHVLSAETEDSEIKTNIRPTIINNSLSRFVIRIIKVSNDVNIYHENEIEFNICISAGLPFTENISDHRTLRCLKL